MTIAHAIAAQSNAARVRDQINARRPLPPIPEPDPEPRTIGRSKLTDDEWAAIARYARAEPRLLDELKQHLWDTTGKTISLSTWQLRLKRARIDWKRGSPSRTTAADEAEILDLHAQGLSVLEIKATLDKWCISTIRRAIKRSSHNLTV